jgi:hypothetical protein
VPRRSIVGWEVVNENAPWLIGELAAFATPTEIGERMRGVGLRPGYLNLVMIPCGYLSSRQLQLYDAGHDPRRPVSDDRLDELEKIYRFTTEVSAAYRGSEQPVFPPAKGGSHRILDGDELARFEALLEVPEEVRQDAARRLSGSLALFALLLHGEQRDGMAGHGPYGDSARAPLFFIEYTDLCNDFLHWAPAPDAIPFDAVSFLYEAEPGVEFSHDTYGGVKVEPDDFSAQVRRMRVLGRAGEEVRPLELDELRSLRETVDAVRDALFTSIVAWPDRSRSEYGGWLFANHLNTFVLAAGAPAELTAELRQRCLATTERKVDELLASEEIPNLYRNLRDESIPLFTPVAVP